MKNFLLVIPEELLLSHDFLLICYGLSIHLAHLGFLFKFITWPWLIIWIVLGILLFRLRLFYLKMGKIHSLLFHLFTNKTKEKAAVSHTSETFPHIDQQYEELQLYSSKLEKKIEERTKHLVDLYQELSLVNQDIEIFLYKAYHNFLGPIATIRGICNIAMLEDAKQNDYFGKVSTVADHMQAMLEKLLEISHIHDHKLDLESIKLISLFKGLTKNASIPLIAASHLNLQFPQDSRIHADAFLLSKAIGKILQGNTRFWSKNRFSHREIEVRLKQNESFNIIHIHEKHLSIPTETLKNLFTMFYRSSSMPEDHGLEFYAARYALRRMGGDISLTSSEKHVTFCLHLPKVSTKRYNDLLTILENEN